MPELSDKEIQEQGEETSDLRLVGFGLFAIADALKTGLTAIADAMVNFHAEEFDEDEDDEETEEDEKEVFPHKPEA